MHIAIMTEQAAGNRQLSQDPARIEDANTVCQVVQQKTRKMRPQHSTLWEEHLLVGLFNFLHRNLGHMRSSVSLFFAAVSCNETFL